MRAVNSWQDDNRSAEVGERARQHIHPSCAQKVSDETIRSCINKKSLCALTGSGPSALVGSPKAPLEAPLQQLQTGPKYHAPGLQTQASAGGDVTELVGW